MCILYCEYDDEVEIATIQYHLILISTHGESFEPFNIGAWVGWLGWSVGGGLAIIIQHIYLPTLVFVPNWVLTY